MVSSLLRFARILVGQGIAYGLAVYGNIQIPVLQVSVGAFINALFKYLREKFPTNKFLTWLPI